jgi:hypothetical protein
MNASSVTQGEEMRLGNAFYFRLVLAFNAHMQTLKIVTLISVFAFASTSAHAAVRPTAASEMKVPPGLIGSWSLVTFDIIDKEGHKTPWCEGLSGLLTYNQNGYMSAAINCKSATDQSPAHAYNDQLFYAGHYSIERGPTVIHHVMNASKSSLIGTDLSRKIAYLDKNSLTLTGDFGGSFSIVWKRAELKLPASIKN